jgi:hypothetical protein
MSTAQRRVRSSSNDGKLQDVGRVGVATRGLLYVIVAWLALEIALGHPAKQADSKGALATIAHQPLGRGLLLVIAVGLAAFMVWSAIGVFAKDGAGRLSRLGRMLVYGSLCAVALSLTFSGRGGGGGNSKETDLTARAIGLPGGRFIVAAVGIGIAIAGLAQIRKIVGRRWTKYLHCERVSRRMEPVVTAIASVGIGARVVVYVLIGAFLVQAAWNYDPNKATGVDGALKRLLSAPHGSALLALVAAGFLAYGLWCAVMARYGPRPGS